MHSVLDINATILVTRKGDNFVITDLATGKNVEKKSTEFLGNMYKYDHDFLRDFKKTFDSKNILLSYEAADFMTDLIAFNRIDN